MENVLVALGGAKGWHRLFCLEELQDRYATVWVFNSITSCGVCFQPPRREYSLDTGESLQNLRSPERY